MGTEHSGYEDYSNDRLRQLQQTAAGTNAMRKINLEMDRRREKKEAWKAEMDMIGVPTEEELATQRYWDNVKYEDEQKKFQQFLDGVDTKTNNSTEHNEETQPLKTNDTQESIQPNNGHNDRKLNREIPQQIIIGQPGEPIDSDNELFTSANYLVFLLVLLSLDYLMNLGVGFVFMYGNQYGNSCDGDLSSGIYYIHWIFVFVLSTVGFLFGSIFISFAKCKQVYIWQCILIKIFLQDIGCTSVIVNAYYYGSVSVDIVSMISVTLAMINVIFWFIIPAIVTIRKKREHTKTKDDSWLGICGVCCCSAAMVSVFIVVYMTAFNGSTESYEAIYSYTIDGQCAGVFDNGDHRIRQGIEVGNQHWLQCAEFGDHYCVAGDNTALEIWRVKSYAQSSLEFTIPFQNLTKFLVPICDGGICVMKASNHLHLTN